MVICLQRSADLHMAQLMSLPLTVSCFNKIQIGFTFLVPAHPGGPGKRAVKRVCASFTTAGRQRPLVSSRTGLANKRESVQFGEKAAYMTEQKLNDVRPVTVDVCCMARATSTSPSMMTDRCLSKHTTQTAPYYSTPCNSD